MMVYDHTGTAVGMTRNQEKFVKVLLSEARAFVTTEADLDRMWLANEGCIQTLSPELSQTLQEQWDKLRSDLQSSSH